MTAPSNGGFGRTARRYPPLMLLIRPPGVYRPQGDSHLLREVLLSAPLPPRARALDIGTGTGLLACAAADAGADRVWAVDASYRAVLAARCNAGLRGLRIRVAHGDLRARLPAGPFDVVTANPPYVPSPPVRGRPEKGAHAWDAGIDGRLYLDPLCRSAPAMLAPGGTFLVVHSALCRPARTLRLLREAGLHASVAARRSQPFGPVLRSRTRWLEERGLIVSGQREEELVVVRACRPHAE